MTASETPAVPATASTTARRLKVARRAITPLVRETTPSMIAARVREAIANGDFPPGSQLGEVELARELGVSRGPLREGLQRLTQEGLLVSHRNRGLFVIDLSAEQVRDLCIARAAVERAAAAELHAVEPVEAGRRLLEVVDAIADAPSDAASAMGITFHERLVAMALSPRLSRMHQTLLTETRMCMQAVTRAHESDEVRFEEHWQIAQSLLDRKPRVTDRLLLTHMKQVARRLSPS